jgi:hypothetical protein
MFNTPLKYRTSILIWPGADLNHVSRFCDPAMKSLVRWHHAHRQIRLCAGDGTPAAHNISPLRGSPSWRTQGQAVLLSRSIPLHGLRATHIPRELRDIEACLHVQASKLYHLGIRSHGARNTLANATPDWRIYCELGQSLIATARRLYATEPFGIDRKETVYALDATTIDLCLSVFP